jgi:hypothetical protein
VGQLVWIGRVQRWPTVAQATGAATQRRACQGRRLTIIRVLDATAVGAAKLADAVGLAYSQARSEQAQAVADHDPGLKADRQAVIEQIRPGQLRPGAGRPSPARRRRAATYPWARTLMTSPCAGDMAPSL